MKIGFFGTPEIAAYCLERLAASFDIVFAVTMPDKAQKRSSALIASPVKISAEKMGIPVLQPLSVKDDAFCDECAAFNADIFVIVAYGKIIPAALFHLPRLKTINLHPSLLPKYRGAAPVESAIVNGEIESGVTVQYINERLDAGDIVAQRTFNITPDINAEDLYASILPMGAQLLIDAVHGLSDGSIIPEKQNEDEATYCGKFGRDSAKIQWSHHADRIHNAVRGYFPKPVAWTEFRGSTLKIRKTSIPCDVTLTLQKGECYVYSKKRLIAGTGSGIIELIELQPEAKKPMDAAAFINGYKPLNGECFT